MLLLLLLLYLLVEVYSNGPSPPRCGPAPGEYSNFSMKDRLASMMPRDEALSEPRPLQMPRACHRENDYCYCYYCYCVCWLRFIRMARARPDAGQRQVSSSFSIKDRLAPMMPRDEALSEPRPLQMPRACHRENDYCYCYYCYCTLFLNYCYRYYCYSYYYCYESFYYYSYDYY